MGRGNGNKSEKDKYLAAVVFSFIYFISIICNLFKLFVRASSFLSINNNKIPVT